MNFFLNWQKQMIMSDLQIKCLWKANVLELAKINKTKSRISRCFA